MTPIRTILICVGLCSAAGFASLPARAGGAETPSGREYHVSVQGNDTGDGSAAHPLRTISAAVRLAQPGDVITVHGGVYRERINPPRGGTSEQKRIVYQAAPGERAVIKGSEIVKSWEKVQNDTWKAVIPNSFFGDFNPYRDLIHGDWFDPRGREHHTGAVYLNGHWLIEAIKLDDVLKPVGQASGYTPGAQQYLLNVAWLRPGKGAGTAGRIPAAGFATQQGVQKAACSEGGECIGWIEHGDWARYEQVDFGKGTTQIEIRAASETSGGTIEIRLDSATGELLGTCSVANTGGWQTWTSVTAKIKPTSGVKTLCLVFKQPEAQAADAALWFAQVDASNTTIWAQFEGVNPNEAEVEINVRRTLFYPDKPGVNYLTIRGFTMMHAATPWAPPTAEQVGLIGTHWSKGWIIEDNDIRYSKCVGISLGKYGDRWDNTSQNTAEGYVETINRALKNGWSKENIGHHIVRNNRISHCEQAGVVGSLGAIFSTITGNVIHDIHVRRLFSGAEMAGIKIHGAIDAQISHNHIYRTCLGIWLDWMAQGTHVTGNLFHDNGRDLFVEVDHGPFLVDNNLFLSPSSLLDMSEGGAYAHNLFAGSIDPRPELSRETPFHKAHSVEVAGLRKIPGGDDRFYNNLLIQPSGLAGYDKAAQPVQMAGNVFLKGAKPGAAEQDPLVVSAFDPAVKLVEKTDGLYVQLKLDKAWAEKQTRRLVTTEGLGRAKVPDLPYEQPDGSPYRLDSDYLGGKRNAANPSPGPFELVKSGETTLRVWPLDTGASAFVPFAIPGRIDPKQALWVTDYKPIEIKSQRLTATGENFRRNGQRVRIWGVNLTFGGNFPSHEDAPYVAERLAAAGVNSVRLHHMDTSRWPRGIWEAKEGKTIEPQALERLDYFINELAKRGIFVNLNLHVGRAHSPYLGLPKANTEYDKIVGIFTPALVDAQKQYAKDLLTHVNPYRGSVRYADDPAIAFVEITNEDSFFMWDGDEKLRTLPPYYAQILGDRFNAWLRQRYGSDDALRTAWSAGTQPLGDNLLQNSTLADWNDKSSLSAHWNIEQHEGCKASLSQAKDQPHGAVRVEIGKANDTEWHLQLTQGGFALTEGQYYTVSFEASSPEPRAISCNVSQAHASWANLGLSRRVNLGPEWKKFSLGFVASGGDKNARVTFAFGGKSTPFYIANVELHPGGQMALAAGESAGAGKVSLFQENESTPRILDRMVFLAETEKAYFDAMRSYIKKDLGCGALVTGTIVFGPLGLYAQSDMDYIDSHSYWQHPTFPGRPWDSANWLIEQRPMTDYPGQATLFRIASERLAGKPFTLSEYNHPAPLDAQAECVPMVASFAAAQDWDGVWLFDYASGMSDWNRQTMSGFFSIDTNPAKWGFVRAGAAVFNNGRASAGKKSEAQSSSPKVAAIAKLHTTYGSNMLRLLTGAGGLTSDALLRTRFLGWQMDNSGYAPRSVAMDSQLRLHWSVEAGTQGFYQVSSRDGQVYTGHARRFEDVTEGKVRIAAPDFVALTVTPLDGGKKFLVTACGRCENTGMQFSPDRRTVGRNWGRAPVQIEAVRGSVSVPNGDWACHALAPDGSPRQDVPITYENDRGILTLSPEYGTMWYLLEQ